MSRNRLCHSYLRRQENEIYLFLKFAVLYLRSRIVIDRYWILDWLFIIQGERRVVWEKFICNLWRYIYEGEKPHIYL